MYTARLVEAARPAPQRYRERPKRGGWKGMELQWFGIRRTGEARSLGLPHTKLTAPLPQGPDRARLKPRTSQALCCRTENVWIGAENAGKNSRSRSSESVEGAR